MNALNGQAYVVKKSKLTEEPFAWALKQAVLGTYAEELCRNGSLRDDNVTEFTSRALAAWAQTHGMRHILIQPGRPMQNGFIERFNGKLRDEHLNECWFETPHQAGMAETVWRTDHHEAAKHATGMLRRAASPARWRCSSIPVSPNTHRAISNPDSYF